MSTESAAGFATDTVGDRRSRPGPLVTVTAVLTALWCAGFAAVNVVFEITGRFDEGPSAAYARGLSVLDWLVAVLKLVGAAIAILSISTRPRWVPSWLRAVLLWGAFATLGLYVLGSLAEAFGMITGLAGSVDEITGSSIAYVLFFGAAAACFGILAISYYRRHRPPRIVPVVGALGAPVLIALVLLIVPTLLIAIGVMPG